MSRTQDAVVVTTAGRSSTQDRQLRQKRYIITQLVRLLCFVLAVALPVPVPAKLVLVVGAFALPWFGVVAANAGPAIDHAEPSKALLPHQVAQPLRIPIEAGRTIDQD